jgi:hypothetical protein
MSSESRTWRPQTFRNGWFPKLSPDGKKVVCGFWQTFVADLTTGREFEIKSPTGARMNPCGWIDNHTIVAHTEAGPANVYQIDVNNPVPVALNAPGEGNWSHARDGHWAISVTNRPYLIRDGKPFRQDVPQYGAVQLAGDFTLIAGGTPYSLLQFKGDQLVRQLPSDNKWSVSPEGDVASGYFGRVRLYPFGQGVVDATLSLVGHEGVPALVRVNGELWIWSQIEDTGSWIIGRKQGEKDPIVLTGFPATDIVAVWDGTYFVIAGNNTDGTMQVRWVLPTAARTKLPLPAPPPAPTPVPPAPTPVPPPQAKPPVSDSLQAPNLFGLLQQVFAAHPEVNTKVEVDDVRGVIVDWFCAEANKLDPRKPWGRKARQQDGGRKNGDAGVFMRTDGRIEIYDLINGGNGGPSWGQPAGPIANGSNGWWSAANPVGGAQPAPAATHLYIGGGNDTGTCDNCGRSRFDAIHAIPESKIPHTYDGGEQDTGLCDICQKARADALHAPQTPQQPPAPPTQGGGTTPVPDVPSVPSVPGIPDGVDVDALTGALKQFLDDEVKKVTDRIDALQAQIDRGFVGQTKLLGQTIVFNITPKK